jgi:predicted DNA-binding transcriptional regulator AlpA
MSQLITRKQLASLFQVSYATILRMETDGRLTPIKIGKGSIRFEQEHIFDNLGQSKSSCRSL